MEVAWWTVAGLGTAILGAYACSALVIGCGRKKPEKPSVAVHHRVESSPSEKTAPTVEPAAELPTPEAFAVMKGHTAGVVGIAWSPDGKILATTSSDRTLRLWLTDSLQAKEPIVRRVNIQLETPLHLLFTTDGKLLMGLESGRVRRLALLSERAADGTWTKTETEFELGHKDSPRAIVSLPSGIVSCGGGTVIRLQSHAGAEIASYDTHQVECYGLAASADGRYIAAASWSADLNVLELESGKGKPTKFAPAFALPGHRKSVRAVAFGSSGRVVTASADGTARLYRLRRPGEDPVLVATLPASGGSFQLASFSVDGSTLLLAEGRSITEVNAETGTVTRQWRAHDSNVAVLAWSPDGKRIASAGDGERNIKIWNA